ncbi:hypothetical protein TIFTF001_025039 [Ficus carica]|uniref:Uncharacterized protein n=1 Tax=Ficus carica TaxID=3494 RepID=A0AA88ANK4_FICCA|nr:hypothetical protein TIFTF001_025039 [Ficus carica]
MSESEKSTATSSPQKNFICPNCNRPFISARPNDHVVSKGGDEQPPAKTLDFVGKCQTPNLTVPAGGPTEAVKSYERMMTNPINAGEEVSSKKKEDVDLELKPLVLK